jgi:hypothetical protein
MINIETNKSIELTDIPSIGESGSESLKNYQARVHNLLTKIAEREELTKMRPEDYRAAFNC